MTKQTLIYLVFIVAFAALGMAYPFLPGGYDSLATTLSMLVQVVGTAGLFFVPAGILWFFRPQRAYVFVCASTVIGAIIAIILSLVAYLSIGASLALPLFVLFAYVAWKVLPHLKLLKHSSVHQSQMPWYLTLIPTLLVVAQIFLAAPLTEWSRNRAIANSAEFIGHIEDYREQYGRYPESLLAQHKDYYPDVVGIEKYHYSPQGDSYNLFFENPRFFLDDFGTREWVVYNPEDTHRMYSHTAWFMLLTPEEQARGQGWYAVHDAGMPHWKYFLFD